MRKAVHKWPLFCVLGQERKAIKNRVAWALQSGRIALQRKYEEIRKTALQSHFLTLQKTKYVLQTKKRSLFDQRSKCLCEEAPFEF